MKDLLQERLVDVKVVEQKDDLTVKVDFFARPPYDPGSESLLIDYGIRELVKLRIEADMMSAYEVLFQSNLQFHEVSMAARLYTSRNPQGRLEEEIVYRTSMSSATLDSIRWDEIDLGKPERRPPWDVEYVSSTLSERGSSTLAFPY